MARPSPYNYSDAGFNGFFRRTISPSPNSQVLSGRGSQQLNFDDLQTSGALGDKLKIGKIVLDGKSGRVSVLDDLGVEIIRIGSFDG